MPTFQTVATFTLPSEMHSARALLETNGIECFAKDELTAQVHNFYSQAIGGVKLQVREKDTTQARALLIEAGYIKEEKHELSSFWKGVGRTTEKIPVIKDQALEIRFLALVFLLLLLIAFVYLLFLFVGK